MLRSIWFSTSNLCAVIRWLKCFGNCQTHQILLVYIVIMFLSLFGRHVVILKIQASDVMWLEIVASIIVAKQSVAMIMIMI